MSLCWHSPGNGHRDPETNPQSHPSPTNPQTPECPSLVMGTETPKSPQSCKPQNFWVSQPGIGHRHPQTNLPKPPQPHKPQIFSCPSLGCPWPQNEPTEQLLPVGSWSCGWNCAAGKRELLPSHPIPRQQQGLLSPSWEGIPWFPGQQEPAAAPWHSLSRAGRLQQPLCASRTPQFPHFPQFRLHGAAGPPGTVIPWDEPSPSTHPRLRGASNSTGNLFFILVF